MYIGVSKMANINKERIIEQMKQEQGITEQLKAENPHEWIGRMNNIQACVREVVGKELIYI